MPSKSERQHALMQAVAHSKRLSGQTDIPQSVAREYVSKDMKAGNPHKRKGY